jgi:type III secretion protein R
MNGLENFTPASALVTVLIVTLAPFVAVMVTSFTKIVVSINLLRSALGLQQTPPAIVVNGIALILTMYVMYPVGLQAQAQAANARQLQPEGTPAIFAYVDSVKEPLRQFLIRHTATRERAFFLDNAKRMAPKETARTLSNQDFVVIVPAFTVSELTAAFQIGFLLFLPFLVIDLVVANILLSMGMMMLSPSTVSLPFKLLLFVMLDGWGRLAHGLVLSYQ